ncbi:MAG: YcxB family protein [Lachnospiraceae bacterium]|nr:YcxB family protein [Lachnospiraceae bacterium]
MEVEFDVKVTANCLYDYMLHHSYSTFQGILGNALGAMAVVFYFVNGNIMYLVIGAIILLYMPWTLFLRSKQQALTNPAFKKPLHYRMTEEGVSISQDGQEEMQEWDKMVKAVSTRKSVILYTSPVNASIFPKTDMGEKTVKVIEMISTHMPPAKVKIRF